MMKIEKIIKLLKKNSAVSDYIITVGKKDSRELFFVKKNMELNRAVETSAISVEIFVDHDEYRGSSVVAITAADDKGSLKDKIKAAVKKAKTINNPWFPIADKTEDIIEKVSEQSDLGDIAVKAAESIFAADNKKNVWLSAVEVFVSVNSKEIYTSKGNHHLHESFDVFAEIIPTVRQNGAEFEVYKALKRGDVNYSEITKEVAETIEDALLRAKAKKITEVKIPKNIPVVMHGEMLELLVRNMAADLSYRAEYNHMNHYSKGDEISNTNLEITLNSVVKGCSSSCGFDESGMKLSKKTIVRNGKAVSKHGDMRYAYYLKENPTGNLSVVTMKGEEVDFLSKRHILIRNFSAPQLESSSGYFGGEVRLALYFDGKKYIPLTSFSVAGNIYKDIKTVRVSREQISSSRYKGPKYMIFEGLNIY